MLEFTVEYSDLYIPHTAFVVTVCVFYTFHIHMYEDFRATSLCVDYRETSVCGTHIFHTVHRLRALQRTCMIDVYSHEWVSSCVCVCVRACVCERERVCMCMCSCVCEWVCSCVYVRVCVCIVAICVFFFCLCTCQIHTFDFVRSREVGGWGRDPFSRNFMKPTPRRKWYLTTGRRFH